MQTVSENCVSLVENVKVAKKGSTWWKTYKNTLKRGKFLRGKGKKCLKYEKINNELKGLDGISG